MMKKTATIAAALAFALIAGCASNRTANAPAAPAPTPAPTSAPEASAAPARPLQVPAASTRKVVLNMTGPVTVTQAKDWAAFKEEWRATFADHAKDKGVVFEVQQGEAHAVGEPGTLLNVYVNDYRMIGIGARIFLGVLTGNAYIDAKVTFTDLGDGQAFGEREYNTSSSAWGGVFAKVTPQQVDSIAAQVFGEIAAH